MNAELKQRWVAALRGGDYEQGRGYLRRGSAFCCLGVLCDLVDPTRWAGRSGEDVRGYRAAGGHAIKDLPCDVASAVGIGSATEGILASMNDRGYSFGSIACWIDDHL